MNERLSIKLTDGYEPCSRLAVDASKPPAGLYLNHLPHSDVMEAIESSNIGKVNDSFHAMRDAGMRWIGVYRIFVEADIHWGILAMNGYDGSTIAEIHSGFCVPQMGNTLSFHHSESNILVNESLEICKRHFNVELERMEKYKEMKLTKEQANDMLCDIFLSGIVPVSRGGYDLIARWHREAFDYIKPRNLWSLFCLCSWYCNSLAPAAMIDRTKKLHDLFDKKAKFKLEPTKYTQTRFA